MEDLGREIPAPDSVQVKLKEGDIVTYVDVDFSEYRRKTENRKVKKILFIPSRLNEKAD